MKKTALLFALILAFCAAWTCEADTVPGPPPDGAWSIEAYNMERRIDAATATVWLAYQIGNEARPYNPFQVTASIFGHGQETAAGRYYQDTGEIEITWTREGTTDWLVFNSTFNEGSRVVGYIFGEYEGELLTEGITAEPIP